MVTTSCPTRDVLLQYSLGTLPDEQAIDLASHLGCCQECQAAIVTLDDADDTLIGRLRTPASDESILAESQLRDALAAAVAMPGGSSKAEVEPPGQRGEEGSGLPGHFPSDMPEMLGEYRLLEELGRGGMGRVYKALHTKLDRVVALKVLPRGRMGDQKAIVRFEREMKAVGRLAHPNIVQAHDAREIDQTPVLIMEYVDGLDLAEIVRRVGPLPTADACQLVRQTAVALQCAHEHGLVHRDIKPSNIMLARPGDVKLLDLGLARFYAEGGASVSGSGISAILGKEETTGTGQAMGTADFMAPEQTSDSRTVDIRADIYSLGATLYKLLSGRAPFTGPAYQSAFDKMLAHRQAPPPSIRQFCPAIPKELAAVLDRLLAKDPAERYQTPAEAAEALAPFSAGCDLPSLLRQAEASRMSPLPPGDGQAEGFGLSPRPSGEGQGEGLERGSNKSQTAASPLPASRRWAHIAAAAVALLLVGGLGYWLGVTIHIRNQKGEEATLKVPNGSDVSVNDRGEATVTPPGAAPQATAAAGSAVLQLEIAKVAAELAAQRALLENFRTAEVPQTEIDLLVQSDPVAKQLSAELGWKKMDQMYNEGAAKPGANNPYNKRYREDVKRLQDQYDHQVEKIKEKALEQKRSQIQTQIIRLQAMLEALRQQEGQTRETTPVVSSPAADAKAIQGTWEIVSNTTYGLISTLPGEDVGAPKIMLPGEESIVPEEVRKTTKIVIDADTFKIIGKHVTMRVYEYRLKPGAEPKVIGLKVGASEDRPAHSDTRLGIYQLAGNELKICIAGPTAAAWPWAPANLLADLSAGRDLLVLRRVGDVVVSEDEKAIQGTWRVETPDSYVFHRDQLVTISPHTIVLSSDKLGSTRVGGGEYVLDPTLQPKRMEIDRFYCSRCIYELQGDRLTLCYFLNAGPNGPLWPRKFAADDRIRAIGAQAKLVVLRRVAEAAAKDAASNTAVEAHAGAGPSWLTAMIDHTAHDFGMVARGAKVQYRFVIENKYAEDVHVQSVVSGFPDCFQVEIDKQLLKTREKANILVTVDTQRFIGVRSGRITVAVDKPFQAQAELLVSAAVGSDSRNGRPSQPSPDFGPAIERIVGLMSGQGIGLAAGNVVDLPKDFAEWSYKKRGQWCAENHVDLSVDVSAVAKGLCLTPHGLRLVAIDGPWNSISLEQLQSLLMPAAPPAGHPLQNENLDEAIEKRGGILFASEAPMTFAIQTRSGGLGALQASGPIYDPLKRPSGLGIRYKLAQPAAKAADAARQALTAAVPEVSVCRPVLRDVTDTEDLTGRTEACQTVEVRSRVGGELVKVAIAGGEKVKQGDVLFELDPRGFVAELEKRTAEATRAKARAQVAAAELTQANEANKKVPGTVAKMEVDRRASEARQAAAAVAEAEAERILAKRDLDYATIRAPISGVVSRPQASVGNLVNAGTQTLATIVSSDPMCVVFEIDERSLLDLRRRAIEEKAKTGRELPIEVRFGTADEKDYPHHCTIESKGERLDPARGVAVWRATVPNPDGLLMPGMFARVQLLIGSPRPALLLPEVALASDQGRRFVFVVGEKNTVERRDVEIGQRDGDLRVVKAGLTPDDRVITTSLQNVRAGMVVKPKPATTEMPPPKFHPRAASHEATASPITAAGTIEPEELIDVGPAVAGQIVNLGRGSDGKPIDYMSPVEQGTLLAKVDPAVYQVRVDQETAALHRALAEVALAEAKRGSETPQVAKASLDAAKATVQQCHSALALARRNLDYTTIESPVKGVIIDRRVNVGQNVSPANLSSLFLIAKDLKKMQVWAQVGEADVPRIRKGMTARFTVDAFPHETFQGTVSQIRLNAAMTQNVVVYTVIVSFDNPDGKLMPYLTATVRFPVEPRKGGPAADRR